MSGTPTLRRNAAILSLALIANLAAVAEAAPAHAATKQLGANVLSGLDRLPSSSVDPATPMTVAVALARPDPAGEFALYQRLYAPGSADYRHFLTPAQFASRFGVSSSSYDATVAWLRGGGLAVTPAAGSHDYVLATGTVGAVQKVFSVTIRRYATGTAAFLANTAPPAVPADLPVLSVVGLNTYQRFATPPRSWTKPRTAGGLLGAGLGLPNVLATTPQTLWSVYDQPDAYRGAGQQVAVFGAGATDGTIADLRSFETEFHLPTTPVAVQHVGPGPFTDTSGAVEWDIDTQAASGMAPDLAGLTLYFGTDLADATVADLFSTWANDPNGPAQANASFGECERTVLDPLVPQGTGVIALGNNLQPVADQILRQAAMEGRTLFSATGDTGSSCPVVVLPVIGAGNGVLNQVVPLTNYPASSPYAVAVGGTVLYTNGTTPDARFAEYAWTFTGGGDTLLIDVPAYQAATPGASLPCVATPDGQLTNLGHPCRGIPDVAAQSGDVLTNGYAIVSAGQDSQGGGTSLSSPLWAGMWARVNQSVGGSGYGFANETLYRLGNDAARRARDFFDVTVGSNGLYTARPGWDYVSGFGTPDVANIIADAR